MHLNASWIRLWLRSPYSISGHSLLCVDIGLSMQALACQPDVHLSSMPCHWHKTCHVSQTSIRHQCLISRSVTATLAITCLPGSQLLTTCPVDATNYRHVFRFDCFASTWDVIAHQHIFRLWIFSITEYMVHWCHRQSTQVWFNYLVSTQRCHR